MFIMTKELQNFSNLKIILNLFVHWSITSSGLDKGWLDTFRYKVNHCMPKQIDLGESQFNERQEEDS